MSNKLSIKPLSKLEPGGIYVFQHSWKDLPPELLDKVSKPLESFAKKHNVVILLIDSNMNLVSPEKLFESPQVTEFIEFLVDKAIRKPDIRIVKL
jgi:hypothetical protein